MNKSKNNLSYRFFTPMKMSGVAIVCLSLVVLWQHAQLFRKNLALAELSNENQELKKNLLTLDSDLGEIKDSASDVRLFQKELIRVMNDIDRRYPVHFHNKPHVKFASTFNEMPYDPEETVKNANQMIFKLADSQHNLRFQTANLLGKAVTIREILSKTPSMMPVSDGYISSDFGFRRDPFSSSRKRHNGIDISTPIGTPVYASADGVVTQAGYHSDFGYKVEVGHIDGFSSSYSHLSNLHVQKGQKVIRGQTVGLSGQTGKRCKGAHVHFEIMKDGIVQDPKPYMITKPKTVL